MVIPFITQKEHRRYSIVLKTITGIAAFLLTIFFVWFEFGTQVLHNPFFLAIAVFWLFFGWLLLLNAWERAGDEAVEDKLDDLLDEIRRLRNDLKGK